MCDFHVDDSAKGRHEMILGIYLSIGLVFNLKLSDRVIEADNEPFKAYTAPVVDFGMYGFKYLNTGNITSEYLFTNAYA